jgi:hypothetical protein
MRADRIAAARCSDSPTGAHWYRMEWGKNSYQGVCRYCGKVKVEDTNFGHKGSKTVMMAGSHAHIREDA